MPDPDPLSAAVAEIKHHHRQHVSVNFPEPGICVSRCAVKWPCEAYRGAAVVDALLKAHEPVQIYHNADDCGHERPVEPEPSWTGTDADEAWREYTDWDDNHPYGSPVDPGGDYDGDRICLGRPLQQVCPACSRMRHGEGFDLEGAYVAADGCIVRPVIAAHLTGGG
jgi:hypothetical protein